VIRRTRTGAEESWTEKTYFTTEASFPTVLRRSEVVSSQVAFISPIDAALAELEQQTRDLAGMYMRFSASAQTGQGASANAFSSALNNAVDAPENSGIALYRRTFLTAEYVQEHPDREGQVEALRKVVDEHVSWHYDSAWAGLTRRSVHRS
jgi:dedicator of cytokinesis protein 3